MKKIYTLLVLLVFGNLTAQVFTDITGNIPALNNSFVAWGDYDNDGDQDLYISGELPTGDPGGGLYQNDNGNFSLVANSNLPLLSLGQAQWADFNEDGNLDIVIMGYNGNDGQTDIYYNNGDGTFTFANAGLPPAYMGDISAVDVNNDGHMDVGITGMRTDTNPWSNFTKIFINNNDGTFSEMTSANLPGMNFGKMQFADYDNDNYPDFILSGFSDVTNTQYTKLWHNNGDGTFTETSTAFFQSWLGDLEWGDYDNDGNVDLIVSGVGGASGTERRTTLYHNDGNGNLVEVTAVVLPGLSHSAIEFADFNADGELDIFLTGANNTPGAGSYYSRIFIQHGTNNFLEQTSISLAAENYGDAEAVDFDNDGDADLVITGSSYNDAPNTSLYRNDETSAVTHKDKFDFTIYPNPSQGRIYIHSENNLGKIEILDITGKIIYQTQSDKHQINIDLSGLHRGIYLLKINQTGKKLIIN